MKSWRTRPEKTRRKCQYLLPFVHPKPPARKNKEESQPRRRKKKKKANCNGLFLLLVVNEVNCFSFPVVTQIAAGLPPPPRRSRADIFLMTNGCGVNRCGGGRHSARRRAGFIRGASFGRPPSPGDELRHPLSTCRYLRSCHSSSNSLKRAANS